jgi:hypothetical protein
MNYSVMAKMLLVAAILLLGAMEVSAQWVFVARKALGRIERMTQPRSDGVPGYDIATVVIEGKADKVYGTALKSIEAMQKFRITRQDSRERIIDFTDGTHAVGLKVSQVNNKVVHLLVTSVLMPDQDSTTSLAITGIMRVCKEVGANCSLAQ